ncbi:DUF5000 domain-containing lipoprotein [Bacteroides sp. 51]|uniref:DUF5000 domain-containing lipoprotein n=1 Tax=Bacteroides sp. 51 TaxID=2302938 RepID=UPI0013D396E7|nr:DUF5000 domain-containing lipoprotein [Bacteroides sp. 51]NDV80402.1 DUF4959 domain-containing protein [Bacteroides sp. 51]
MKKIYLIIVTSLFMMSSCDEKRLEPITPSLGKPGIPTEINVEVVAGGAIISYRIPETEDILGVKAVYQLADGKTREVMSSLFNDEVKIEGYVDTAEKRVTLYALNRAMTLSDPVEVSFTPLEAAISKARKSMQIAPDFGGAQYTWKNEDRANLTLEVLTTDSTGVMTAMKVLTTGTVDGKYSLRGYDTDSRWFAAIFRDNFGNATDTIYPVNPNGEKMQLVPIYEQKIDKKQIRFLFLNNDASFGYFDGSEDNMIDDNTETFGHSPNGSMPAAFSLDLGSRVKLSRVVIHQRNNYPYGWGNPKTFEIYECTSSPEKNGDWNQWNHILDCEVIKPSGLPIGNDSEEDKEALENGHDFTFDLEQEPIQYIRFRFTSVWTSSTFCHPAEITFYGDPNYNK